jgi:hypothetical protein
MKQSLKERFQQLAGIKSLYTENDRADRLDKILSGEFDEDDYKSSSRYDGVRKDLLSNDSGELKISLEDLTFDQIVNTFTNNYKKPQFKRIQPTGEEGEYYTDFVNFPNSDDSSVGIGDKKAWESWKSKIMGRYGNVTIILKPKSENWFDKVFIDDDSFNQNRYKFLKK